MDFQFLVDREEALMEAELAELPPPNRFDDTPDATRFEIRERHGELVKGEVACDEPVR
jgi:hypothetical protein